MTTKQIDLLAQYFAGEQLDQVIKLVDIMRSSDKVNYEMGLMCMKELGLYSRFIQMIREYYDIFIGGKVFKTDPSNIVSLSTLEYETFLLEYSFCPNGCDLISCIEGKILETIFEYNILTNNYLPVYYINMKHPYKILLPLFATQIGTLLLKECGVYTILFGGDAEPCTIQTIATNQSITYPSINVLKSRLVDGGILI